MTKKELEEKLDNAHKEIVRLHETIARLQQSNHDGLMQVQEALNIVVSRVMDHAGLGELTIDPKGKARKLKIRNNDDGTVTFVFDTEEAQ